MTIRFGHSSSYIVAFRTCLLLSAIISLPQVEALSNLDYVVGMIGYVLQWTARNPCTFALLEYHPSQSFKNGSGKSAIALKLLGVDPPLEQIPWPKSRTIRADSEKAAEALGNRAYKLRAKTEFFRVVTSDMPFIGLRGKELHVAVPIGEPFLALWDLARYMSRTKNMHYRSGAGSIDWLKEFVTKLACCFYLDYGKDGMFVQRAETYRLDHVFFLDMDSSPTQDGSLLRSAEPGPEGLIARQMQLNPAYHTSLFWQLNQSEHQARVHAIARRLESWPTATWIKFSAEPFGRHIDDVAKVITNHLSQLTENRVGNWRSPATSDYQGTE